MGQNSCILSWVLWIGMAVVFCLNSAQALAQVRLEPSEKKTEDNAETPQSKPGGEDRQATESAPVNASQISESQLIGLPLNGRSYSQLATLQSGVSDLAAGSGSRGVGGGGLTVSGGRPTSNTFLLDGTNIMDTSNQVPRSAAGVQLGADAVLQVQVFSTSYGAEYGRNSGGVLNSITRSGTPKFHGTLFEYFRNSKLDARNFFDSGPEPTPFKRNQFGFTLTGPVVKDRTFFTGSFEGLRDRLTETVVSHFPDEQARQGIITNAAGEAMQRVPVHPSVVPYLGLYPLPNSVRLGRGVGEDRSIQFLPTDESFFVMRVDHKISDQDSFFVRYTFDDATNNSPQGTHLFTTLNQSRQQYLALTAAHIFTPAALNSMRAGFTRPVSTSESLSRIEIPRSLFFIPSAPQFGQINVPGLSTFGPAMGLPSNNFMTSFQFADDLIIQKGSHGLKLGFEVHRYRWNLFGSFNAGGIWLFNSLESFLQGGKESPPTGEEASTSDPSEGTTSLRLVLPGGEGDQARRQTLMGFYFQDAYQVSPRVQFNLGFRYEFATRLTEKHGRLAYLPDPLRDTEIKVGRLTKNNPTLGSLAPRIGIAWSPWGNRATSLNAGFGIYHDQALGWILAPRRVVAPFYKHVSRLNFDSSKFFPDAVAAVAGKPMEAYVLDYNHFTNPMVLRYHLTLQEQLPGGWRIQTSYVGVRGNHLLRSYEVNLFPVPTVQPDGSLFFPRGAGPVNPAFQGIDIMASDAQSFYNALSLSANKSFSEGISLQANYTYSRSVDDASRTGGANIPDSSMQYGLRRTLERGLSDFDIRHRLVVNHFYTFPFGSSQRWLHAGWLENIFGGWRLGGIFSIRSGVPVTAQVNVRTPGYLFVAARPNLLPDRSNNPTQGMTSGCEGVRANQKLGARELYFDPCVFTNPLPGTLGTTGRNTIVSPGVFNVDVSLQKQIPFGADQRLQFRAEFFNILNHTNLNRNEGGSTIIFSGASGRRNSTAGRIGSTATTARQIQFALRFSF